MKFRNLLRILICSGLCSATLQAHGDPHREIAEVTKKLEKEPSAKLYLKRGELQLAHGEHDEALSDFQKVEELDPSLDILFFYRGKALFEAGRLDPARASLDQFLGKQADHGEGYLLRARVLAALKNYRAAAKDFDRSIALTKRPRPEQFVERALVHETAGDVDAAIRGLDAGMESLGAIWSLQSVVIEIEVKNGRYDSALKRVEQLHAVAARKESPQALRGEILAKAGRNEEALQAYQDSLASIEALPPRVRALRATQDLEKKVRAAVTAIKPT